MHLKLYVAFRFIASLNLSLSGRSPDESDAELSKLIALAPESRRCLDAVTQSGPSGATWGSDIGVGNAMASLSGRTGGRPPIGFDGRAWICLDSDAGGVGAFRDADREHANADKAAGVMILDGVGDAPPMGKGLAAGLRDEDREDRIGIGTDPAPMSDRGVNDAGARPLWLTILLIPIGRAGVSSSAKAFTSISAAGGRPSKKHFAR